MTDLEDAWASVHDAMPPGWHVGRPNLHDERRQWEQYAFDATERPKLGHRSREWTAVGVTELACLREMARCLGDPGEGKVPRSPIRPGSSPRRWRRASATMLGSERGEDGAQTEPSGAAMAGALPCPAVARAVASQPDGGIFPAV